MHTQLDTHIYWECGKLACGEDRLWKRGLEIIFFHLPTACSDMALFIEYKAYERIIWDAESHGWM